MSHTQSFIANGGDQEFEVPVGSVINEVTVDDTPAPYTLPLAWLVRITALPTSGQVVKITYNADLSEGFAPTKDAIARAVPGITALPANNALWFLPVGYNTASSEQSGNFLPNLTSTANRAFATTNLFTSTPRLGFNTATLNTSFGRYITGQPWFWRGNAAGLGGFYVAIEFGVDVPLADQFIFAGLMAGSNGQSANPSTMLNSIGVGGDRAETTLKLMHNDGSGTCTKVDLGAGFPLNTAATDMYLLELWAEANASSINYQVTRRPANVSVSGVITSDLPANDVSMYLGLYGGPGNSAQAFQYSLFRVFGTRTYP